jgi:CpXC protein
MSKLSISRVTCPKCQHQQDFGFWESVNADRDPQLRDRLLSRELFRFKCDQCGNIADAVYPTLYHDMAKKYMIFFTMDGKKMEPTHPLFDKMMSGYNLRTISSVNQLVEKVLLLATDFDERILEIFKLVMEQQMEKDEDGELLFGGMLSDESEGEELNFVWVTNHGNETYDVPLAAFREFEDSITSDISFTPINQGEWLTIDRAYVLELMDAASKEDSN